MQPRTNYLLGVDFGSDSVRCLVVDAADGSELASAVVAYPRWAERLYCDPAHNRYRQHPLDYVESLEASVRQALAACGRDVADAVCGISFDTTASTPVLTDAKGTPLALLPEFAEEPDAMFVLWKDHTALAEADEINDLARKWEIDYTRYSGGTYSCEWVWAKMLHCLRRSPGLRAAAYSWVEHCDWISALLVGDTTPETIARSRCVAGHKAMWHASWGGLPAPEFLEAVDPLLGIFRGHLYSDTVTGDACVGRLCGEWAARLGLKPGIAVGVGGICGQVDGSVLPGYIGFEAGQAAFGDLYAWFRRVMAWPLRQIAGSDPQLEERILGELTAEAERLPLTPDDPVALDWHNGRRTPDADPRVRGALDGLTLATSAPAIYKALVEATVFGSRAIDERMLEEGVPIDNILAIGGIARKSPFVMQTMADVIGVPIRVVASDQACALGAAMFAAVAAGLYGSVQEAQRAMCPGFSDEYLPDMERHAVYDRLYDRYLKLGGHR